MSWILDCIKHISKPDVVIVIASLDWKDNSVAIKLPWRPGYDILTCRYVGVWVIPNFVTCLVKCSYWKTAVRLSNSKRVRFAGRTQSKWEKINVYKILMGIPTVKEEVREFNFGWDDYDNKYLLLFWHKLWQGWIYAALNIDQWRFSVKRFALVSSGVIHR